MVLEGVEVEPQRGNGGLELVGHGAHEVRLALVETHLAQEKDHDQDEAADEEKEEEAAEEEGDGPGGADLARARRLRGGEDPPGDGEHHRHCDEAHSHRQVVPLRPTGSGQLGGFDHGLSPPGFMIEQAEAKGVRAQKSLSRPRRSRARPKRLHSRRWRRTRSWARSFLASDRACSAGLSSERRREYASS
jgi:hypothetical protein